MALGFVTALRNTRADAVTALVDASSFGQILIYDGSRPGAPGGAIGGATLLATFTLANPSAPAASGGVVTYNAIPAATIAATGTATWFRVQDGAAGAVYDGNVAVAPSSEDMVFDSVSFQAGKLVSLDSVVITEGNA